MGSAEACRPRIITSFVPKKLNLSKDSGTTPKNRGPTEAVSRAIFVGEWRNGGPWLHIGMPMRNL